MSQYNGIFCELLWDQEGKLLSGISVLRWKLILKIEGSTNFGRMVFMLGNLHLYHLLACFTQKELKTCVFSIIYAIWKQKGLELYFFIKKWKNSKNSKDAKNSRFWPRHFSHTYFEQYLLPNLILSCFSTLFPLKCLGFLFYVVGETALAE